MINQNLAIDNFLYEFMTSEQPFLHLLDIITNSRYSNNSSPRSKIPLSPQSPHTMLRSSDVPKEKTNGDTSSMISSELCDSNEIPCIYNSEFSEKIGNFGRCTVYRLVPKAVAKLESRILAYIETLFPSGTINLQEALDNPFYYDEMNIHILCPGYYFNTPEKTLTIQQLICESLFNVPLLLSRLFNEVASGASLQYLSLNDEEQPYYENIELTTSQIQQFYARIQNYTSEQRLFRIFSQNTPYLSFNEIYALCFEIIIEHPQFEFVQPFIYENAFAYTTAVELFYDLDLYGYWQLHEAQYVESGIPVLQELFEIQNKKDITGEQGIFGYEEFYVLFCMYSKYSKGDIAKNLSEIELRSYNEFSYSEKSISAVFKGKGRRLLGPFFAYADFIVFVLSDLIIDNRVSCEYFFNMADNNNDGFIDNDDVHYYIQEQVEEWDRMGLEVEYQDVLRQMGDLVCLSLEHPERYSFSQFYSCKMYMNFFNMLFSGSKFEEFENRDQYVGNKEIQFRKALHGQSPVWQAFWTQAYDDLIDDEVE